MSDNVQSRRGRKTNAENSSLPHKTATDAVVAGIVANGGRATTSQLVDFWTNVAKRSGRPDSQLSQMVKRGVLQKSKVEKTNYYTVAAVPENANSSPTESSVEQQSANTETNS